MTAPPGVILDTSVTGDAITDALKLWLPFYLAHLGRLDQARRGDAGLTAETIAIPKSWHQTSDRLEENGVRWPGHLVPAIYVVYDGLADDPRHDGDGKYSCTYRFDVAAVVHANSQDAANRLSQIYYAALVGVLMQADRSLGGHAAGITWRPGAAANVIPPSEDRRLAGCGSSFDIQVDDVIDIFEGIDAPTDGTPPAEAPERQTFQSAEITVEPEEADQ
jgi:hypothetical protein